MCPQVITPPDSANRVISQLVDQYASQTGALLARAKEARCFPVLTTSRTQMRHSTWRVACPK